MTEEEQNSTEDKRLRRDPRDEVWESWQGAVLLKNEIEYYASLDPPLIKPFDPKPLSLKSASYHLHLGEDYQMDDKDHKLSDKNPKLVIPPHGLAVVSTLEELSIPGFLVGRWNLRVKEVYEGLLWVGGAQVDPGYEGHLYCPLYNLSTRPVELKFGDSIFTIDFVRTTRFVEGKSSLWERIRQDSLGAHDIHRLQSAMTEDIRRVEELTSEVRATQRNILPVLAILIAAVAVIAVLGRFEQLSVDKLSCAIMGISVTALALASLALLKSCIRRKRK